jgi:transcription termination factor Rho
MILFNKFRKAFLTIALATFMLVGSAWEVSSSAWAASSEIAKMPIMSGKSVEGGISNMKGNSKEKAAVKEEKFEVKTKEALKNSIGNPNYVPGGNDKELEMKDRKSARDMKSKALDTFE